MALMHYTGKFRTVENRPYFGTVVNDQPMEVGLFSDGFQLGCFVEGEWIQLCRVFLKNAYEEGTTGEMKMEWSLEPKPE